MEGFHSGSDTPVGITPVTDWTSILEHDYGLECAAWYRYNTVAAVDVSAGFDQSANDAAILAVAVSEVVVAAGGIGVVQPEMAFAA